MMRAPRLQTPRPPFRWTRSAGLALALLTTGLVTAGAFGAGPVSAPTAAATPAADFAARIQGLSEPSGYFDTDNLISNESSYLHVMPALEERGVHGGVYIGVGPDQNFSYIAKVRPSMAYVVDIRRDNLLLHLLFKALFELAPTRLEYLALLTGRAPPPEKLRTSDLALPEILRWVDTAPAADHTTVRRQVETTLSRYGVPLTGTDLENIARFHAAFIADRLDLQFHSFGRRPNGFYPTFRQLLMATDRTGRRWSYLDSDEAYRFLRDLQGRDAIVPVVGDVSGPHALRAIGAEMSARGLRLSAIYVSNVEDYLYRGSRFGAWVQNLGGLPRVAEAVVIRSVFGGGPSVSEVQSVETLTAGYAAGRYQSYGDLVYRTR